jgi:hypothetical protein
MSEKNEVLTSPKVNKKKSNEKQHKESNPKSNVSSLERVSLS